MTILWPCFVLLVAKEQGFRSRAAFKISQINRKFPILQNAKVVLDLCAAPGGWAQVVSRTMPKQGSLVVAVDILPIRSLGPNVITLIGDITTDSCKADIRQNLQGQLVDVVLHDGAPNVGASYDRDAYLQNEIALHALKCATQHLKPHGHFVTKLYRSRDYQSFVWVAQQFFGTVQAVKPAASRSQSAEIFLVCQDYVAPTKIDPRMLDPKHVFAQVEGDSTGGGNAPKKLNVFHKSWAVQKRHREGYDHTEMDFTMRKIKTVKEFMSHKVNPIDILSTATGLNFKCDECADEEKKEDDCNCYCQFYRQHKLTTPEVKSCLSDLRVLNKSDFKSLLVWRGKLQDDLKAIKIKDAEADKSKNSHKARDSDEDEEDSDDEEEEVQKEISDLRQRRLRDKKKIKKKERTAAAKRRRRAAFGMDLNAIDVPEHEQIFSLATITSKGDLEATREVDLDKVTYEEAFGADDDDDDDDEGVGDDASVQSQGDKDELDEETGYSFRMDRELDDAYDRYLKNTKDGLAKSGTKMAKRSKKLQRLKAAEEAEQDQDTIMNNEQGINYDTKTYAKMLQGPRDSDDDDSSADEQQQVGNDSDGFDDEPLTPAEHARKLKLKLAKNPLIHKLEEAASDKTARWFSNPLFESIGNTAKLAALPNDRKKVDDDGLDSGDDGDDDIEEEVLQVGDSDDDDNLPTTKRRKVEAKTSTGMNADDVFASMPKTDKQIRHEKRLKASERQERRAQRKARLAGENDEMELVPQDEEDDQNALEKLQGMSDAQKTKHFEARALIKAGLGGNMDTTDVNTGFEVVAAVAPLPKVDSRVYNSDNEDYDSDDYARTLALGTMMLRQSKAKQLVDASYNRYAWNDPEDLPDWLVDDENRNYRPQLPIPEALLQKLKDKQMALSVRPIAKVAEARARKSRRAKTKLVAAKKKAEAVANSSELSDTMKLKAISKAMRGQDTKNPSKTYVIAKKGRNLGAKGVKLVDKRMKNDKRAMERKTTKSKKGKQNGLVGSKRRRSHS